MQWYELILWISLIFVADLAAQLIYDWWKRSKKPPIKTCDFCNEPTKIYRTKDKKYWLCRTCRQAYYATKRLERRKLLAQLEKQENSSSE